jgi:hypothetical protein
MDSKVTKLTNVEGLFGGTKVPELLWQWKEQIVL